LAIWLDKSWRSLKVKPTQALRKNWFAKDF